MPVRFGRYNVTVDSETYHIYPVNSRGETCRVTRVYHRFYVQHESGTLVVFKRYLHQKRWYWNDSRMKGPCSESHVLSEVSRMLFDGDTAKAGELLIAGISGRSISNLAV